MNIKDNNKYYYINQHEWEIFIEEEVIEDAIADASLEVINGIDNQFQLAGIIDRQQLIATALNL
ncbi:conserved hypothetical protein ['Nostoc azollae' 0708]|jgi:hypothetical protein|uniref:Uncharacterized protein n=1 Tax=Nostoc azollae (strain 0708) TaxID=551115 RepID=D7DVQ5_NOSA0|nr:conserved hypothetical protein ['Nostoc azollae' 0708]